MSLSDSIIHEQREFKRIETLAALINQLQVKINTMYTLEDLKAAFEAGRIADSWSEKIGWTNHHTFEEWIKTRKP